MLRRLVPVRVCETHNHATLLYATRTLAARDALLLPALKKRFDEFDVSSPFNAPLGTTPSELTPYAQILLSLYTSRTPEAKAYREKLMTVEKLSCPYCGISAPTTLDHILPKSVYREFSMYAKNLIPCCADCNRIKDTSNWDNMQRCYLNPYDDSLLDKVCIHLIIQGDLANSFHAPEFDFAFHWAGCLAQEVGVFQRHFKNLDLKGRLRPRLLDEWRTLHRTISNLQSTSPLPPDDIWSFLQKQYTGEVSLNGHHTLRSLVHRAILDDRAILTFLCTEDPR